MKKFFMTLFNIVLGIGVGFLIAKNKEIKNIHKLQEMSDKHLRLFMLMSQWVKVKQEGHDISTYFCSKGYRRIVVYGMSYIGENLILELKNSEVQILYGADVRRTGNYAGIRIVQPDEIQDDADIIVVTAITFFDEIEENLSKKVTCPIISLDDILYNF